MLLLIHDTYYTGWGILCQEVFPLNQPKKSPGGTLRGQICFPTYP